MNKTAMNELEPIRQAARQLVRELQLLDGRYCIDDFSFSECHLLTELELAERATASELAERLVLEKSTVSRLVSGLQAQGLLMAMEDGEDRRRRWLVLTDPGRDACARIHAHARRQVSGALAYVSPAERHAIRAGLEQYARALRHSRQGEHTQLRPMQAGDNDAVATIIRTVMTEFDAVGPGYSIEDPEVDAMFEAYQGDLARFWVVEQGGTVLGCGGIAPLAGGDGVTCELQKMYFLPALRGQGMGARLLGLCMASARDLGFERCYLETLGRMDQARRLYRRFGFLDLDGPLGKTGHCACNNWMALDLKRERDV